MVSLQQLSRLRLKRRPLWQEWLKHKHRAPWSWVTPKSLQWLREAKQAQLAALAEKRLKANLAQVAAKSPRSPWHPEMRALYGLVSPHLPEGPVKLVLRSFDVARRSRCLEPPGDQKALSALGNLWKELSGDNRQQASPLKYLLGAGAGLLGGLVLGYAAKTAYEGLPVMVLVAIGAAIGVAAAHMLRGSMGWNYCMLRLIISERRSPVRKAMVTDQAEIWVPKALMLHRQKEWRTDRKGASYVLLRLEYRQRLATAIHNIIDCLDLLADLHVMLDSAGKGQRVWNRRLAKNATAFGTSTTARNPPRPSNT